MILQNLKQFYVTMYGEMFLILLHMKLLIEIILINYSGELEIKIELGKEKEERQVNPGRV
jgi:hypothetical protein